MTNKEIFIKSIQEEIDNGMELPDEAIAYFEELKIINLIKENNQDVDFKK